MRRSSGHCAACRQASRSAHSPIVTIRPESSATGMNTAGGTMPLTGWHQRASASKPVMTLRLQVDERLVVQLELVALDRVAKVHFELAPVVEIRVHRAIVELVGAAAFRLDRVEREVGSHQQFVDVVAVARSDGDADADAGADLIAVDLVRLDDRLDDVLGQRFEVGQRRHAGHDRPRIRRRPGGPGCPTPAASPPAASPLPAAACRRRDAPACR